MSAPATASTPRSSPAADDEAFTDLFRPSDAGLDWVSSLDFDFATLFGNDRNGPSLFGNAIQFCNKYRLVLDREKQLKPIGRLLFVRRDDTTAGSRYGFGTARPVDAGLVIKQQLLPRAVVDFDVTPNQSSAELLALFQLNFLMAHKGIAPLFCELKAYSAFHNVPTRQFFLSTSMPRYAVDMLHWLHRDCPGWPTFSVSTDPTAPCVYTQGAGYKLACSEHKSDHATFNAIIRAVLLQVIIALAQAQRYVGFTHNDLHAQNVMLDVTNMLATRVLVTAMGTFVLPHATPGVRIIDFQHSAFDRYSSRWEFVGRVHGVPMSVHNGMSMQYDVWRFCTNLAYCLGTRAWDVLDADIKAFLLAQCRFNGTPQEALANLPNEQQWYPYMVDGSSAEELLQSPLFDRYRQPCPAGPTVSARVETPHAVVPFDDELYARRRVLCTTNSVAGADRANLLQLFCAPSAEPALPEAEARRLEALLRTFTANYAGNAMTTAVVKHKHTVQQKAAFLYMELLIVQRAFQYFWRTHAKALHNSLAEADAKVWPIKACATLDALVVVLKADFTWLRRMSAKEEDHQYNQAVREALLHNAGVRGVARAPPTTLPAHRLAATLLLPTTDADNAQFEQLLLGSVSHTLYA